MDWLHVYVPYICVGTCVLDTCVICQYILKSFVSSELSCCRNSQEFYMSYHSMLVLFVINVVDVALV